MSHRVINFNFSLHHANEHSNLTYYSLNCIVLFAYKYLYYNYVYCFKELQLWVLTKIYFYHFLNLLIFIR